MFLFCCFVLPNGQEKPKLKTSLFLSYDGVRCFCSVVLLYHYAYLYCGVFFHPDRQYTRISLRNSLILCVRLLTFGDLLRELSMLLLLQLLAIIDLLQQFEDYVKGIALRKRQKHYFDMKIRLKIFTKWE